jgi:hypothetical protein
MLGADLGAFDGPLWYSRSPRGRVLDEIVAQPAIGAATRLGNRLKW